MAKNGITDEQLEQLKQEADVLHKIIKALGTLSDAAGRARVFRALGHLIEGDSAE